MEKELLLDAIKRLISCGILPEDAAILCHDFISKFGYADLDAYIRAIEVAACGRNSIIIRRAGTLVTA